VGILGLQVFGARSALLYAPFALLTWAATYASGVHPTIAGVAIGLLTPVRTWWGPQRYVKPCPKVRRTFRSTLRRSNKPHAHP
jgi:NhaA family Na+:H+ antiporter